MIEIKMTGMCEGCTNADLEAVSMYHIDNRGRRCTEWTIICSHKYACEAAARKAKQEAET